MNKRMCRERDDCIAACLRTMLDDDEVPHFFKKGEDSEKAWLELRTYLRKKSKYLYIDVCDFEPFEFMAFNNPDIPYMLLHSSNGENHAVICINDKVVHNPAHIPSGVDGPTESGYWFICVLGELDG